MSDSSSIYLPTRLKNKIIKAAQAEGFEVGVGRNSRLASFIEMLMEFKLQSQSDSVETVLYQLIPELRFSIIELSRMGTAKQRVASKVLKPLLVDWQTIEDNSDSINLYPGVKDE
jgi:hypothetical protein